MKDNLEIVKEKFENDKFAKMFGIVLDELTEKTVKMHLILKPEHCNFYGRPHGGAIYALADAAFSVIGNNQNIISVALDSSISYHYSPEPGSTLHVEGHEITGSRKIGSYLFSVYTMVGTEKKLVATMKSTLYKTGKPIVE
ncbi:MAG: PaaI family thioesterase [Promethearchaeota archaeon]